MRNRMALYAGAALGAALSLTLGATAQAQDTTVVWKGAPQLQNDTLTFKVRGRVYYDFIDYEREAGGVTQDSQLSRLRTARLGVEGTWNANWAYKAELSLAGGTTAWEDLILEYKPSDFSSVMIGNFKTVGFENVSSSRYNMFMERGPIENLLGIGRVMTLQYKMNGENWTAAAFVHGDSVNSADPALGVSEQLAYGFRGTFAPINTDTSKLHLGLWARERDRGQGGSAISYAIRPNTAFGPNTDTSTGAIGDSDTQFGVEGLYIWKNFSVQGEYASVSVDRTNGLDQDLSTYYVEASWFPTGEMRNLDVKKGELGRTKVLNPMTAGGMGALELAVRYDNVDLTDVTGVATAGEYSGVTVGATWYPHPYTRFMVNYTDGEHDLPAAVVDVNSKVLQMRAQFDF
jgi:phosphate-selective porin OprO and OprP